MRIDIIDDIMTYTTIDAVSVDQGQVPESPDFTVQADSELAQKIFNLSRYKCIVNDLGELVDIVDAGLSLQEQINKIESELQNLDQKTVRYLREILLQVITHIPGLSSLPGIKFLDDYESQSETLRSKLSELTSQVTTSKEG